MTNERPALSPAIQRVKERIESLVNALTAQAQEIARLREDLDVQVGTVAECNRELVKRAMISPPSSSSTGPCWRSSTMAGVTRSAWGHTQDRCAMSR